MLKKFVIIYKVLNKLFTKHKLKIPQLVLIGDVYQLSPVSDPFIKNKDERPHWYDNGTDIWKCKGFFRLFRLKHIFNLTKNYRQVDTEFNSICNSIRKGLRTSKVNEILKVELLIKKLSIL